MGSGARATRPRCRHLAESKTIAGPSLRQDLGAAVQSVLSRWGVEDWLAARLLELGPAERIAYRTNAVLPARVLVVQAACEVLKLRRLVEETMAGDVWPRRFDPALADIAPIFSQPPPVAKLASSSDRKSDQPGHREYLSSTSARPPKTRSRISPILWTLNRYQRNPPRASPVYASQESKSREPVSGEVVGTWPSRIQLFETVKVRGASGPAEHRPAAGLPSPRGTALPHGPRRTGPALPARTPLPGR